MIIRAWLIVGGALIVVAWVLTVVYPPQPFQGSAPSAIKGYRDRGLVPEPGQLVMSKAVGHQVFEIPDTDAQHAREAAAAMGDMPGMHMPGMQMPGMATSEAPEHGAGAGHSEGEPADGEPAMAPMQMQEGAAHGEGTEMAPGMKTMEAEGEPAHGEPAMAPMQMQEGAAHGEGAGMTPGMKTMEAEGEPAHGEPAMAPMQMQEGAAHGEGAGMAPGMKTMEAEGEPAHGEPAMAPMGGHETQTGMPGMAMPGMEMAEGGHGGGHAGGGGLALLAPGSPMAAAAREVRIEMSEWGFSPASLHVKHGETVRLVVRNSGNMPHEFMLMTHAGMSAVDYRLQRADWNLLEHEAIYEREVVLPGDELEVTIRIMQPGAWMYMCMFPYHMQFGMMGVMATEGMAVDMGGMNM